MRASKLLGEAGGCCFLVEREEREKLTVESRTGYGYYVQESHKTKFHTKTYANNYLYSDKALRIIHAK